MSLTKMNVMRAVASDAAPAKRMPPIGTSKRPVARRRLMRSMVGCWQVSRSEVGKPLRTKETLAIFMILAWFRIWLWLGPERCALQIVDEGHHPVALVRIWQAAAHCTEIVGHMGWVRGAGNNCRHPFICEQVFEKKLRPAAGEVLSPIRNCPTAHGAEEATTSERLGGQHAGLDLGRERQNALLRFPVADRIVNLHEIWLLARDHRFHGRKIAVEG